LNGTYVTGYLYHHQTFCPRCIGELFIPIEWIDGSEHPTETILDYVARDRGLNRHDTTSYRSDQFPQPLYLSEVTGADRCVLCGRPLYAQGLGVAEGWGT
jgi:hypothetical protein